MKKIDSLGEEADALPSESWKKEHFPILSKANILRSNDKVVKHEELSGVTKSLKVKVLL